MNDAITKLNLEDLENVAGGKSGEEGSSTAQAYGVRGVEKEVWIDDTLEKMKFAASGVCPRCGRVFSGTAAVNNHIKEWESGQK